MTKAEAIQKVMEDNGGTATWDIIYNNIEEYYPDAKRSREWGAGIRGVLYRDIGKRFKRIGLGIFGLIDYKEESREQIEEDPLRMHSFIEGICLELGNFDGFDTFTADPSAKFKDNISLRNLATMDSIPDFTYTEIVRVAKKIDVIWFNKKGFQFPKRAIEVVDSIGTLGEALNRAYQLSEFNLEFYILGKAKNRGKFEDRMSIEPYVRIKERYKYSGYEEIINFYNKKLELQNFSL
jgi:hypothetical protein